MDQIYKQFGWIQQNRQDNQMEQMKQQTVQFEMRSIHSSNSQNSATENRQSSPSQISSEAALVNIHENVEPSPSNNDEAPQKVKKSKPQLFRTSRSRKVIAPSKGQVPLASDEASQQSKKQKLEIFQENFKMNQDQKIRQRSANDAQNRISSALNDYEEVMTNNDVNLLEDSFMSSKQIQYVESVKIYPKRSYPRPRKQQLGPLFKTENVKKIMEEVSPHKQQIDSSNSNTKNRPKSRQFLIACQRNNIKMIANQQKPKEFQVSSKKKQEKSGPEHNYKDYEIKPNLDFEQYFQKCKFQFCGQKCAEGNLIQMICAQKCCDSQATHCNNNKCLSCKQSHKNCYLKFSSEMFNKSLQRNLSRQKKIMQIVYETYSNILNEIQQNREKIMKFLCVQGVNQNLLNKLQQRYKVHGHISFKSREILGVLQMLNTQSQNNQYRQRKIYDKMRKDQKDIIKKLQQQMHLLLEPYTSCEVNILDSHLISSKADAKFVLENLNYPKDMQLLYRASQHEFSINRFHQICDKEDNTFTIIKTEFGKLIGGFTPIKWDDKYGRDRSNKTFLLSISMKERLDHIKHGQSAICYRDEFGPSFGGLFEARDIQIFEQNGVINCITNFPNAYNWKKFFISNQESWRFLTGVPKGKKCRVMDYQVFKVHFWKKEQ